MNWILVQLPGRIGDGQSYFILIYIITLSNTFFQFKEFIVHQDKCAMKVCTDACLFGAWVAAKLHSCNRDRYMLDIGTGTGLLSLMLAQQVPGTIRAIDIDKDAVEQANDNFNKGPWRSRMYAEHISLRGFRPAEKFDLIISNPPFYANNLLSPDENRNAAMHDATLTLPVLFDSINELITDDGHVAILLPYHRFEEARHLATLTGFHLLDAVMIRQTQSHTFFRVIMFMGRKSGGAVMEHDVSIHQQDRAYTNEFVQLLRPYYLKL